VNADFEYYEINFIKVGYGSGLSCVKSNDYNNNIIK
jgi:hypothetical protein